MPALMPVVLWSLYFDTARPAPLFAAFALHFTILSAALFPAAAYSFGVHIGFRVTPLIMYVVAAIIGGLGYLAYWLYIAFKAFPAFVPYNQQSLDDAVGGQLIYLGILALGIGAGIGTIAVLGHIHARHTPGRTITEH